jgi:hypothetical protein
MEVILSADVQAILESETVRASIDSTFPQTTVRGRKKGHSQDTVTLSEHRKLLSVLPET